MGKENKNKESKKQKNTPPPIDSELAAEIKRDIGRK